MKPHSMLHLALRRIKEKPANETSPELDPLEQAMEDFQNATSKQERASAFRAALELANSKE